MIRMQSFDGTLELPLTEEVAEDQDQSGGSSETSSQKRNRPKAMFDSQMESSPVAEAQE